MPIDLRLPFDCCKHVRDPLVRGENPLGYEAVDDLGSSRYRSLLWERWHSLPGAPEHTGSPGETNMYLNRLTLSGFIGNDPEAKATNSASTFATFSVATKRSWKIAEGEW